MNKHEILSPVGGWEQLVAAVRCGANAVYLGTSNFNARRNADNFTDLNEVVSYAHARGVRVYVTVNTVVFDEELEELKATILEIVKSDADAVIVQDLAVYNMIRKICPDLKMHASTQMGTHNLEGVKLLEKMGFSKVVLARELSFEEIEYIAKNTSVDLEVFIHGSLCMSFSSACYLSSIIGGRSGNRGLCAQPCRLNFETNDRDYVLSLKDVCNIPYVKKLMDIGISSFKIEGRMKRPEYVASSTKTLLEAMNDREYELGTLQDIFSRGGFTEGYMNSKVNLNMFGRRQKEDAERSAAILGSISELYRNEYSSIPVDMYFRLREGEKTKLEVSDWKNVVCVYGAVPEVAIKLPLNYELIKKSMNKTGGTPFYLEKLKIDIDNGLMISSSELNSMRRSALEQLLALRSELKAKNIIGYELEKVKPYKSDKNKPLYRVRVEKFSQLDNLNLKDDELEYVIIPVNEVVANEARIISNATLMDKIIVEVLGLCFEKTDEEKQIFNLANLSKKGFNKAIVENIYSVDELQKLGYTVFGSFGLNITNTMAIEEYAKLGISDVTTSFEINLNKIYALGSNSTRGIVGYGYLPLMKMRNCPVKTKDVCKGCEQDRSVYDRLDYKFEILCKDRKYVELLNCVPLYLAEKNIKGIDFITLYFTNENSKVVSSIFDNYKNSQPINQKRTAGLYYRELI